MKHTPPIFCCQSSALFDGHTEKESHGRSANRPTPTRWQTGCQQRRTTQLSSSSTYLHTHLGASLQQRRCRDDFACPWGQDCSCIPSSQPFPQCLAWSNKNLDWPDRRIDSPSWWPSPGHLSTWSNVSTSIFLQSLPSSIKASSTTLPWILA